MLKSIILKKEKLENLNKKFGELDYYHPCFIDGDFALFTETELNKAINRGQKNKEDYLPRIEKNLKRIKIKRIKKMKSQINTLEKIKKNSEDINSSYYFPCFIDDKFALFTRNQLNVAINRGRKRQDLLLRQNWLFKIFSKLFL